MTNPQNDVSRETTCISVWARGHFLLDPLTGERYEINCKSWRCERHRKSWQHKWRVVLVREVQAAPIDRLITLTFAEKAGPNTMTRAKQLLFRRLRELNGPFEYFAVLEYTVKTRLPHLHILARSLYINVFALSALWELYTYQAGCDKPAKIVYIQKPEQSDLAALYVTKYALDEKAKNQDIPASWQGRKITYSQHFFQAATPAQHWQNYLESYFGRDNVSRETSRLVVVEQNKHKAILPPVSRETLEIDPETLQIIIDTPPKWG